MLSGASHGAKDWDKNPTGLPGGSLGSQLQKAAPNPFFSRFRSDGVAVAAESGNKFFGAFV